MSARCVTVRSVAFSTLSALALGGCGLTYSRLPEIWDETDPDATYHMEVQVKKAIYCELKAAALEIKADIADCKRKQDQGIKPELISNNFRPIHYWDDRGHDIATAEDQWFPDSWGILVQLTIQAEEKSSATPNVSFKTPMHNVPVNFPGETIGATGALAAVTYGPLSVAQSFALGVGGQVSSDNTRYDKYTAFYSAAQLNVSTLSTGTGPCRSDVFGDDPKSSSSPFLNAANLGIRDWLESAVRVINWERTSRKNENGLGPPIAVSGAAPDSSTYDNKFIVVTDANIAPNWNLVRIGTPATPMFDAMRTRTHELLMTVGPGANPTAISATTKTGQTMVNLSNAAANAFFANQIGSAVANALRPQ